MIQQYPWEEADAVWFMLTGETPWVAPLTWQARWFGRGDEGEEDSFGYGFVTLKVELWVDPKLVWEAIAMYSVVSAVAAAIAAWKQKAWSLYVSWTSE